MHIPTSDGRWVDEGFERLAAVIEDFYGPHSASQTKLELRWIPPENRSAEDIHPYAIVDVTTNTAVMYAHERNTPEEILEALFMSDMTKGNVLNRLEAREDAERVLKMKEQKDLAEEQQAQAAFLAGSPLNYVNFNGHLLDSERRRVGRARKRHSN